MEMLKIRSYEYAAITNQIGKIRRIATLRAYHNGDTKMQITLTVATVERPLTKVSDYTLGSFSDSKYETFYYRDNKECIQIQRNGLFLHEFMNSLDENDRRGIENLFAEYAKDTLCL